MTKSELARQLRARIVAKGELAKMAPPGTDIAGLLERQTEDEIITSYIQCSGCGNFFLSLERAVELARTVETAAEWLESWGVQQHQH